MSIARITTVGAARGGKKGLPTCCKCRTQIEKGQPYRWWTKGFRGQGGTFSRCMKSGCTPRQSELESSLLADIMSAQEDAIENLERLRGDEATTPDQIREEVELVANAVEEVASAYRDADEAMGGSGSTESAEKADTLEGNDISWDPGDEAPEQCEQHEALETDAAEPGDCEECDDLAQSWRDAMVDEAIEVIENVELP